jgi:hypothetical protein
MQINGDLFKKSAYNCGKRPKKAAHRAVVRILSERNEQSERGMASRIDERNQKVSNFAILR